MFTYITPKRLLMIVCTLAVMIGGVFWYSSNPRFATDSSPCKEGERYVTRVMGGWELIPLRQGFGGQAPSDPAGLCISNEELKQNLVKSPSWTDRILTFLSLKNEAKAAGNTYYVATNGDDSRSCGEAQNINTPKQTIRAG